MNLAEIRARLDAIVAERQALHEAAGDGALTTEAQTAWDGLDTEETGLRSQLTEAEAAEARAARVAESRARWQTAQVGTTVVPFDGTDARTAPVQEVRSRALKAAETLGDHLSADQQRHLAGILRSQDRNTRGADIARRLLLTENPAYRSAFQKLTSQAHAVLTQDEARAYGDFEEFRAASIGTDSAGGYGVPVLIDPTIVLTSQGSPNDILRLATVKTITTDEWKGVTSDGMSWSFDAEAEEVSDDTPTLVQPTVTTRKAQGFIPYSIEVGMDYPGFAEEMSKLLGEGYSELLASVLTTGTSGSNQPIGLVTRLDATTTIEREVATAGTIAAADVYALWDALPRRWRNAATWMSSTDVQNSIRQLGTTDPNFTVNITEAAIARLFGREYPVNDYMQDDPAGTGVQPLLIVGDFAQYLVAQRAGMSVENVPHLFGLTNNRPTGQRGWYAWARVGADTLTTKAFRLLVNKSA